MQLHSDFTAIQSDCIVLQNDFRAIAERLQSDFSAIAQRLCNDFRAIAY
jgi:hypothetical protein